MNFSGNFLFKVNFWDDTKGKEEVEYSIISADSFRDAAEEIENYYGDELIAVECEIQESSLIILSEQEWKRMKEVSHEY